MQLALSTWQEVEDYLRTSRGIIVPIGSTEQHGPNGLIGTDHLDAEFVAKGVAFLLGNTRSRYDGLRTVACTNGRPDRQ